MSGGSFDYLCHKSPGEAIESTELADMLAVLYREWPTSQAATDTAKLLAIREELERRVTALSDVWMSVEWWKSSDFSRDDAADAVADYERKHHPAVSR